MKIKFFLLFFILAIAGLSFTYMRDFLNKASAHFPIEVDITIEEGMTLHDIVELLKEKRVVQSSLYLQFVLSQVFADKFAQAGTYRFDTPLTTLEVASIITNGTSSSPLLKITFPEGFSIKNIQNFLPSDMSVPDIESMRTLEGHLFPDTYFISKNATFNEITTIMQETMSEKLFSISDRIKESTLTQEEIIILASLVEREAKDVQSKRMVAGILQNRLALHMPLQVDAAFMYILNKTSIELTQDDLLVDSPYNTYSRIGLPPTPISNPGMESILAVLEPIQSDFLYYLTAQDGTFYYAKTFEEHKKNKEQYLR